MGRPKVAPVDYCCPYRKACPELMGRPALEVRFAVSECERLERQYGMLAYETNLTIRNLEAKRQQRDPLAFLQTLIADGCEAAKPMLYRIPPDPADSS